jgi:hypothetical protein
LQKQVAEQERRLTRLEDRLDLLEAYTSGYIECTLMVYDIGSDYDTLIGPLYGFLGGSYTPIGVNTKFVAAVDPECVQTNTSGMLEIVPK